MGIAQLFRDTFGGGDGTIPIEGYELAEASVPTITVGGVTYNLIDYSPGDPIRDALPSVFRARQMTADALAMMPPQVYDRSGGLVTSLPAIVRRPDPAISRRQFIQATSLSMSDAGFAIWRKSIDARRGQPYAAKLIDPARVTVQFDPAGNRRYQIDGSDVPRREIEHIGMNLGVTEPYGRGPASSTRLAGLMMMVRYAEEYFADANDPKGILHDPHDSDGDEAGELLDDWNAGATRGNRVLSGGLTWTRTGASPGDSEWTGSHAAGVADVATLWGIPVPLLNGSLLGGSTSMVYQNLSTVYRQWLRDSLAPSWITPIEEAWSNMLPNGTHVELDTDKLTQDDRGDRIGDAAAAIAAGIMTVEEGRELVGLPTSGAPLPQAPRKAEV